MASCTEHSRLLFNLSFPVTCLKSVECLEANVAGKIFCPSFALSSQSSISHQFSQPVAPYFRGLGPCYVTGPGFTYKSWMCASAWGKHFATSRCLSVPRLSRYSFCSGTQQHGILLQVFLGEVGIPLNAKARRSAEVRHTSFSGRLRHNNPSLICAGMCYEIFQVKTSKN